MSLRNKIAALMGLLVVAAATAAGALSYAAAGDAIRQEVDRGLRATALTTGVAVGPGEARRLPPGLIVQRVAADGSIIDSATSQTAAGQPAGTQTGVPRPGPAGRPGPLPVGPPAVPAPAPDGSPVESAVAGTSLPVSAADRAIAASGVPGRLAFRTVDIDGEQWRMVTLARRAGDGAVQVARNIGYAETALAAARTRATLVSAAGGVCGALLAWLLAGVLLARLSRLTSTAHRIAQTGDDGTRVDVRGRDEVADLAAAFNAMLTSLHAARARETQFLQDAAHELRTPLTSLRTNAELLSRFTSLDVDEQAQLATEMQEEAAELALLVEQALALDAAGAPLTLTQVDLAAVCASVARSAARTGAQVTVSGAATVTGDAGLLRRVVANLVANAVKYAPRSPVRVTVTGSGTMATVTVDDDGDGFDAQSREHAFDRFWRSERHRGVSGSGLGLAIVADIVARHGGTVTVGESPTGGARVTVSLPPAGSAGR